MSLNKVSTGRSELDRLLNGGYGYGSAVIIRGGPGCGKTILGLHFVASGAHSSQKALVISFAEPEDKIRAYAKNLNIDISKTDFLDLTPTPDRLAENDPYEIFIPDDVERRPITRQIVEYIEKHKPQRVFIDGFSIFRYLYADVFQYRRQVIALMRFLRAQGATAVFASEMSPQFTDDELAFSGDSVITLRKDRDIHYLTIEKHRSGSYERGSHAFIVTDNGMRLLLDIARFTKERLYQPEVMPTGINALDTALGGGLYLGSTLGISGPPCSGKTTLALTIAGTLRSKRNQIGIMLLGETEQRFRWRVEHTSLAPKCYFSDTDVIIEEVASTARFAEVAFWLRQMAEIRRCTVIVMDGLNELFMRMSQEERLPALKQLQTYTVKKGIILITTTTLSPTASHLSEQYTDVAIQIEEYGHFGIKHNRFSKPFIGQVTWSFDNDIRFKIQS